jgi:hypothetical protein
MSSDYQGRHQVTRSSSRPRSTSSIGRTLRRPVVTASILLAVVATTAAGVSADERNQTEAAAYTVSTAAAAQANEMSDAALEDSERRAEARNDANRAAAADVVKERAAAKARAAAAQQARREAAARAAREKARKALEERKEALIANARSNPRDAARAMLGDFGWGSDQFSCLDSLWTKESGWDYRATNPSSGAYGIPQSLPGSKMATVGSDWQTNPVTQITWGLNYIQDRYGSPCSAWAQSQATNWY